MDKTPIVAMHPAIIARSSKCEAQEYITKTYPGAVYDESTDSFMYRGKTFDYFMSGVGLAGGSNAYMLMDTEDETIWVFNYADHDEHWKYYLENKEKSLTKAGPNTKMKLLDWLTSRVFRGNKS